MSELTKSSETETPAFAASTERWAKVRPSLLPLGAVTLIGLGAVVWLAFAVMESVVSRTAKRAEVKALLARLDILRTDVSDIETELEKKQAARSELQRAVDELASRKETLDRAVAGLRTVIERAEAARGQQEELDRAVAEQRRNLRDLERDRKQLISETASEGQREADLRLANDSAEDRLKTIRNDIEVLRVEHKRAEDERAGAQNELAGLRAEIKDARRRLTAVAEQLNNRRKDLGTLESQLDGLRTQTEAASRDAGREAEALESVRRRQGALAGEVAQLGSRKFTLEQEIAGLERDRDAIGPIRKEITATRAEFTSAQETLHLLEARLAAMRVEEQTLVGRVPRPESPAVAPGSGPKEPCRNGTGSRECLRRVAGGTA